MEFKIHKPKNNEQRIVKKFALFPTRMDEETIIWLEFYFVLKIFDVFAGWYTTRKAKNIENLEAS